MDLCESVYRLLRFLPKEETYALSDQIRRAAVSIPSNIAEGQARNSTKEFIQFLSVAQGSRAELDTQLLLCIKLNYVSREQAENAIKQCEVVGKKLTALIRKLSS